MATYYSPNNYQTRFTADDVRKLTGDASKHLAKFWDLLTEVMDDGVREAVHAKVDDRCTLEAFLAHYLELAEEPLAVVGGRYVVRRGHPGTPGVHPQPSQRCKWTCTPSR